MFPAGLQRAVKVAIQQMITDVDCDLLLEGMLTYRTSVAPGRIRNFSLVSNSFLVLCRFDDSGMRIANLFQMILRDKGLDRRVRAAVLKKERTFRIVASEQNTIVSVPRDLVERLERRIVEATGLRPDRARPNIEFWCYLRSEGFGFFARRLTRRVATERDLHKGELRPEMANILCQISEPSAKDVFLDPFCGYGAIPLQRVTMPHNLIFASDRDAVLIQRLKQRIKESASSKNDRSRKMIVRPVDALSLGRFEDGFIHKIVTDPPWGLFSELDLEPRDFCSQMLHEMARVVRPTGIIVILTANKSALESCVEQFQDRLCLLDRFDVLVSGKKAAIYKLERLVGE